MSLRKLYVILSILLTSSFIFSDCTDGTQVCLSLDGNNLNYNTTPTDSTADTTTS